MHIEVYDGKKYLFYTSADFEDDFPKLVKKIIRAEKNLPLGFNAVFGIQRGARQMELWISHALNLTIGAGGVTKNTLVVDDIADTGTTLFPFINRGAVIATLFYHRQSIVVPNIWLHEKMPHIYEVVFPWERYSQRILTMFPLPSP